MKTWFFLILGVCTSFFAQSETSVKPASVCQLVPVDDYKSEVCQKEYRKFLSRVASGQEFGVAAAKLDTHKSGLNCYVSCGRHSKAGMLEDVESLKNPGHGFLNPNVKYVPLEEIKPSS